MTVIIGLALLACADSETKNAVSQDPLEVPKLDVQTKKPIQSTKKSKVKNRFSDEQYLFVKEKFSLNDSFELLKFYEEDFVDFKSYEYIFRFSKFDSAYHGQLNNWVTFDPVEELEYAGYGSPQHWKKTDSTLQTGLEEISELFTEWVRIEYYQGELTLSSWAPRYYCFTDTVIYDNTFQDGPYIHRYISIDKTGLNKVSLRTEDVQSESNSTIDIYFLAKGLMLLEQSNKYLDGSSDCALYISKNSINQYPLIAIESSEVPTGVSFSQANCEYIRTSGEIY